MQLKGPTWDFRREAALGVVASRAVQGEQWRPTGASRIGEPLPYSVRMSILRNISDKRHARRRSAFGNVIVAIVAVALPVAGVWLISAAGHLVCLPGDGGQ